MDFKPKNRALPDAAKLLGLLAIATVVIYLLIQTLIDAIMQSGAHHGY